MRPIAWGILGTGTVAAHFADALNALPGARLHAVASRSSARAEAFAAAFGAKRAFGSHAELLGDPEVDVVYVATATEEHAAHATLALRAGKPVLCEKPFATDAAGGRAVIAEARRAGLFCMEAMWMRFAPALQEALAAVRAGAIGEPLALTAALGFANLPSAAPRLFAPPGGGALLDLGVYPLSLAHALWGAPAGVRAASVRGPTGVDETVSAILSYAGGRQAIVSASIRTVLGNGASIHGTEGVLRIDPPVYCPHRFRVERHPPRPAPDDGVAAPTPRWRTSPLVRRVAEIARARRAHVTTRWARGNGYGGEAAEVMRCLREGLLESPTVPLDDTLGVLEAVDAIRRASGAA